MELCSHMHEMKRSFLKWIKQEIFISGKCSSSALFLSQLKPVISMHNDPPQTIAVGGVKLVLYVRDHQVGDISMEILMPSIMAFSSQLFCIFTGFCMQRNVLLFTVTQQHISNFKVISRHRVCFINPPYPK